MLACWRIVLADQQSPATLTARSQLNAVHNPKLLPTEKKVGKPFCINVGGIIWVLIFGIFLADWSLVR